MAVIELNNPEDENATINYAFNQLQCYKKAPDLLRSHLFNSYATYLTNPFVQVPLRSSPDAEGILITIPGSISLGLFGSGS